MKIQFLRGIFRRTAILAVFSVIFAITSCSGGGSPVTPGTDDHLSGGAETDVANAEELGYLPGEVLVRLNESQAGLNSAQMVQMVIELGLEPIEVLDLHWGTLYRLDITSGESVPDACDRLNGDPRIMYAEPNYLLEFHGAPYVPNDPMWDRGGNLDDPRDSVYDQWGPAKSGAAVVWNETKGSEDVIVAVIDTGVNYNHEDLYYQVWYNMDEGAEPGDHDDDDNNGWINDFIGWDFDDNDNGPMDQGYPYHGSACAGIIGADQDNGRGLTGIAPGVRVMAIRVYLGWNHNTYVSSVVNGLNYAYVNEADIASMSFGSNQFTNSMRNACDAAYDNGNGVVLMASAGNENNTQYLYPSAYDSVMAVAAVIPFSDNNNPIPEQRISPSIGYGWGSSYGDQLEISGYGDKYTTTYGQHYDSYWDGYDSDHDWFGGTSCACPMTAGVMALLKTYFPGENASWLRTRLSETCDDIHSVGFDNQSGNGRVNAVRAIWGSDRYSDFEDADGFVPVNFAESPYQDCIHDVPGNPYEDVQDLYTITPSSSGSMDVSLYIYNWGEDIDVALFADSALTNLLAGSFVDNDPNNNTENFEYEVMGGVTYYLKVYSPADGNSSLYDIDVRVTTNFNIFGTDIAPSSLPAGGDDIGFLKLEITTASTATLDRLNVSMMSTVSLDNFSSVKIYNDSNSNGFFDGSDTLISSSGTPALNRVIFNGLGLVATSSDPAVFFIAADIVTDVDSGSLIFSVESYKDAVTSEGYVAPYVSFPIKSGSCDLGG